MQEWFHRSPTKAGAWKESERSTGGQDFVTRWAWDTLLSVSWITNSIDRSGRVRKIYSGQKLPVTLHTESFRTRGGHLLRFGIFLLLSPSRLQTQRWGPVIQLNLVRSVNFIAAFISDQGLNNAALLSPRIRTLCYRLVPLRKIEEDLVKILSRRPSPAMQKPHSPFSLLENVGNGTLRFLSKESTVCRGESSFNKREYGPIRRVLDALGEDIAALWRDESLQEALKSAEIDLEEEPGLWVNVQSLNLIPE